MPWGVLFDLTLFGLLRTYPATKIVCIYFNANGTRSIVVGETLVGTRDEMEIHTVDRLCFLGQVTALTVPLGTPTPVFLAVCTV